MKVIKQRVLSGSANFFPPPKEATTSHHPPEINAPYSYSFMCRLLPAYRHHRLFANSELGWPARSHFPSHIKSSLSAKRQAMSAQDGLEWVHTLSGPEPRWTKEPQIAAIAQVISRTLGGGPPEAYDVRFLAQGAFNKLYTVRRSESSKMADYSNGSPADGGTSNNVGEFVMRLSLPVDPRHKTLSEVATLEYVRAHTDVPVPRVVAFDATRDSDIGFEWILMERLPGRPLAESWRTMTLEAKEAVVKRVAHFAAQLFRLRFRRIGNIYRASDVEAMARVADTADSGESSNGTSYSAGIHYIASTLATTVPISSSEASTAVTGYAVGRIVSMPFFWGDRVRQDVPRGPFTSSHYWLAARLLFVRNDAAHTLKTSTKESELEDAHNYTSNVDGLLLLLRTVFPSTSDKERMKLNSDGSNGACGDDAVPLAAEAFALMHDDLSNHNILVDADTGQVTGVVDWECVTTLPLWKVCQLPAFLVGRDRAEKPIREGYAVDEYGEVNELYWEHLLDFEHAALRRLFAEEMARIEPAWEAVQKASGAMVDFELAVQACDDVFLHGFVKEWLDDIAEGHGEVMSLTQRLRD
jgi:hypothetical protein